MAIFQNVAFACLLVLSIQQVALAVTCYSCLACNSVSSSTATAVNSYCYKAVGTQGSITVVNRDASSIALSGSTTTNGITATYYSCSTDYCNSGHATSISLGLAFSLITFVTAAKWMMMNN